MKTIALILNLSFAAFAGCRDLPEREFYASLRISLPAQITYWDGRKLEVVTSTKHDVLTQTLEVTDKTEFPANFGKTYKKGRFWIFSCADGEILWLAPLVEGTRKGFVTRERL